MDKIGMTVRYIVAGLGAALVGFGVATAEDTAAFVTNVTNILGAAAAVAAYGYAVYKKIKG